MIFRNKSYIVFYLDATGLSAYKFSLNKDQLTFIEEIDSDKREHLFLNKNILLINSNEVISKPVESNNLDHSFEEAFPAFKKADLYYDYQIGSPSKLSIIKKEAFDKLKNNFDLDNLMITTIRLGSSPNSFNIDELNSIQLSEYAIASQIKKVSQQNNFESISGIFKNLRFNKRFFEFAKWSAIAFFLIGLVINFYYHEKYRNDLNEAQTVAKSYKDIDKKVENLTATVSINKQLVNSDNRTNINRLRFLNDLILKGERKISFSSFTYQSLKTKLDQDKEIRLAENQLKISAIASNRVDLDKYVNTLRRSKKVKELVISNINQNSKQIEFELIIQLKDAR